MMHFQRLWLSNVCLPDLNIFFGQMICIDRRYTMSSIGVLITGDNPFFPLFLTVLIHVFQLSRVFWVSHLYPVTSTFADHQLQNRHLSRYSLRWRTSCLSLLSIMYLNWWNALRIHSYPSQLMMSHFFCILYMTPIFCPYFQRVPSYFIVLNSSFTLPSSIRLVKLPSLPSSPISQTSSLKSWSHAFLISPLTNSYDWDYICIYYLFSLHCHSI